MVTHLSADVGVAEQAEVRVGYKIDSGPIREKYYGPGNFTNRTRLLADPQRDGCHVSPRRRAHDHAVRAHQRGGEGKAGWFENGCFVAEARTK